MRIHPADNVEVLLRPRGGVPAGHKVALRAIRAGEAVVKYGFPVGVATADVRKGEWVHTHNMRTALDGRSEYEYAPSPDEWKCDPGEFAGATFDGFLRADGRAGVRNEIWIVPTVGCVNSVASALAAENQGLVGGAVEGIYAFGHPYGCSQTGEDHARTRRLLAALCRSPNAGGVLVLSLGCENLTQEQFRKELGEIDEARVRFLVCQDVEDELAEGSALLAGIAEAMRGDRRETLPASKLVVGLKCGGSDGLSGITANPAVGRFSDILVSLGGSTVLTEVPEMFGAERLLMDRASSRDVYDKTVGLIERYKNYFVRHGQVVYENPSPGNKAGGISTLEDKSLGCTQKSGSAPVSGVLGYGDRIPSGGLWLLEGPGNDMVACTNLTAAGCSLILFTTGRGTPLGAPVPTIKIASNAALAAKKSRWIDFDASPALDGDDGIDERFWKAVLAVAGGAETANERNHDRQIAIFKDGVTL